MTIKTVAPVTGVSIKTLSRVINAEANVRQSTRDKVKRVVERLNYQPNMTARSLASGRTYILGLAYNSPSPNYVATLQRGIVRRLCETPASLAILSYDGMEGARNGLRDVISRPYIDGILLAAPLSEDAETEALLDRTDTPHVLITSPPAPAAATTVGDGRGGRGRLVVKHLVSLGRRRIVTVTGRRIICRRASACRASRRGGSGKACRWACI